MSPHHLYQLLSRSTAAIATLWASGGFLALTYLGVYWERRVEKPAARAAMHVVELLAKNTHELRIGDANVEISRSLPAGITPAEAGTPRALRLTGAVRSAGAVGFLMPATSGLVSVVIPTYNRADILGRAIESALAQTYPHLEVVVADDGSSDPTQAVAERYGARVVYVRQDNAGVSAARNFGMRHSRGEFIAFLDSDDSWTNWKIEAEVAALTRHRQAGLVWTDMSGVDEAGRMIDSRHLRIMYSAYATVDIEDVLRKVGTLSELSASTPVEFASASVREGDLSQGILLGNLIHTSTVLFRRSCCELTGGFDETFERAGEDYEFYIRLCSAGRVVFIDAPSTQYRIGAADQLTAPSMMLEIARNDLRAIQKWSRSPARSQLLPVRVMNRRFAESFAWVGEAELDAGHRWLAASSLAKSLVAMPRMDRRGVLLAGCVLPSSVRDKLRWARVKLSQRVSRFDSTSLV